MFYSYFPKLFAYFPPYIWWDFCIFWLFSLILNSPFTPKLIIHVFHDLLFIFYSTFCIYSPYILWPPQMRCSAECSRCSSDQYKWMETGAALNSRKHHKTTDLLKSYFSSMNVVLNFSFSCMFGTSEWGFFSLLAGLPFKGSKKAPDLTDRESFFLSLSLS